MQERNSAKSQTSYEVKRTLTTTKKLLTKKTYKTCGQVTKNGVCGQPEKMGPLIHKSEFKSVRYF